MTTEISLRDDELNDLLTKIKAQVADISKATDKQAEIATIKRQLNRGQVIISSCFFV